MSARSDFDKAVSRIVDSMWLDTFEKAKFRRDLRKALAGYRLVGPGELDPETVERCAKVADDAAHVIEETERECRSWGGPDPRGPTEAASNLAQARRSRQIATAIRSLGRPQP